MSERERELVDAATAGKVLKCSQLSIEQLSVSDNTEHIIPAELLRELLLKRCDKPPDPQGVRLCGARITGTLNLTHVETLVGMELRDCSFDRPVRLDGAHLPWLALTGSQVPALIGEGLQVDGDLSLDKGFRAIGNGEAGAVSLRRAHVAGDLCLSGAKLTNETGSALYGVRIRVDGNLRLDEGFRASGYGDGGAVSLVRAHIAGVLTLSDAELTNKTGPALMGFHCQVDDDLLLNERFRATGYGENGVVNIVGAHIAGMVFCQA